LELIYYTQGKQPLEYRINKLCVLRLMFWCKIFLRLSLPPIPYLYLSLSLLSKSKLVIFHWFQYYIFNYINQWNMHCLSVIILILISETISLLIKIAEKQWIFTNDHSYKYSIANQWIIDSDLESIFPYLYFDFAHYPLYFLHSFNSTFSNFLTISSTSSFCY